MIWISERLHSPPLCSGWKTIGWRMSGWVVAPINGSRELFFMELRAGWGGGGGGGACEIAFADLTCLVEAFRLLNWFLTTPPRLSGVVGAGVEVVVVVVAKGCWGGGCGAMFCSNSWCRSRYNADCCGFCAAWKEIKN